MAGPVNGLAVGPSAGVTGSDRRSLSPNHRNMGALRIDVWLQPLAGRIGRPLAHPPDKIEYARLLKAEGHTLGQIAAKTGIPKTSLHRYLAGNVPATGGGILRPEGVRAAGPNRRARGAAPEPVRRAADPAGAWHFPAGRNTHPLS